MSPKLKEPFEQGFYSLDPNKYESLMGREYQIMRLIGSGETASENTGELSLRAAIISINRAKVWKIKLKIMPRSHILF